MFDMLKLLMILCASTKNVCILVYQRYCVAQKLPRCDESEMRYILRKDTSQLRMDLFHFYSLPQFTHMIFIIYSSHAQKSCV